MKVMVVGSEWSMPRCSISTMPQPQPNFLPNGVRAESDGKASIAKTDAAMGIGALHG